jgi:hypothetical protein
MTKKEMDPIRLKQIAKYQRYLCVTIWFLILSYAVHLIMHYKGWTTGGLSDPSTMRTLIAFITFVASILIILLAANVYNSILIGIILGIICITPCFGILILLAVSQQATRLLKQNGIKVGLIGADASQFD